ncbi:MAG TPA: DUF1003 domain-containing protein [Mycobacteriales bacterium]|nr:DUF1003 domain-containing protein [Mycobacteriales bacterium]
MPSSRERLDQPRIIRRGLPRPHYDPEAFGRFSESIARFFGTARFLVIQTVLVAFWIGYNAVVGIRYYHTHHDCPKNVPVAELSARCRGGLKAFDPFPFILLNLAFSTQAAYAAPLILLAQNRQADRDRVSLEEDRAQYARAVADTDYLTREVAAVRLALGEVVTRDFLRSELQRLADDLKPDNDG